MMVKFDTLSSFVVNHSGMGNFAAEDIGKGTVVWKFDTNNCLVLTADNMSQVPRGELKNILWRSFLTPGLDKMVVLGDGAEYTNHSDTPNVDFGQDFETWVAAADIKKGEEMVINYNCFGHNIADTWKKGQCTMWLEN